MKVLCEVLGYALLHMVLTAAAMGWPFLLVRLGG